MLEEGYTERSDVMPGYLFFVLYSVFLFIVLFLFLLFGHLMGWTCVVQPAHAEPICLGQVSEWSDGIVLPQRDPAWEHHDWLYTTLEGRDTGACRLCDGEWEKVTFWVAGLEQLCDYEDYSCRDQLVRCPVVIGC